MPPFQTLLFDLDGVLIDSEPVHARIWFDALREAGVVFPENEMAQFVGLRVDQIFDWLRENDPPSAARIDRDAMMESNRRRYLATFGAGLEQVAGADEFLSAHRGRRKLGLVTSSRLRTVGLVLAHFGWRNTFEVVVGADHVKNTKPHPEPYQQAAQRLRAAPETCLVFEDSIPGVQSARAAGMVVCGVATTFTETDLRGAGAKWVVRDFSETGMLEEMVGK